MCTAAFAFASLTSLAGTAPAAAETIPYHAYRVDSGDRVRMWSASDAGTFRATDAVVTAADAAGLTVVIKDRTELVAFDSLERLDVRRGWRYLRRAAVIGFVIGAVAGGLDEDGDDEDVAKSAALYGAVGAGVGAISAAALWPARWVPVDLDGIRPSADRGAARLSVSISF